MIKIGVIIGSVRDVRVGRTIAEWALEQLPKNDEVEYEIIDLKEWDLPILNEPKSPALGEYEHESTKQWSAKISEFDGYIFVTSEYNHGYSASMKNAIDTLFHEWAHKPAGFVGYGGMGGARAVEQLALVTARTGMVAITSNTLNVIDVWSAIDEQGKVKPEFIRGNVQAFSDNLLWWAKATKTAR